MKNIKTYEMFISDKSESANESLKSVVVGTMLSLSTLLSNDIKADSISNTKQQTSTTQGDKSFSTYQDLRRNLIEELKKVGDIDDASLSNVKQHLIYDPIESLNIKEVNTTLKKYCDKMGYKDLSFILSNISKIDIDSKISKEKYSENKKVLLGIIKTLNMDADTDTKSKERKMKNID